MNRKHASLMGIVAGSIVAVFYGCADDGATSNSDELSSTEDGIAALRASSQATQDAAKACFDTFKTCEASAASGDTTCRDQLKACLPDAPSAVPGCGNGAGAGEHGDGGASHDAGVVPSPFGGDAGRGPRAEGDAGRGQQGAGQQGAGQGSRDAGTSHTGDAGTSQPGSSVGQGWSQGGRDDDRGAAHGACGGGFDFPRGALGGCRDNAGRSMQHGMGCDGARAEHHSCVAHSFDASLTKLCKKASELCAQPSAPADVCTRITSACATLPQSDAGVGNDASH